MKKMLTVIVLLAVLAAGCNSQESNEPAPEQTTPPEQTTETTAPQETTIIDESPVEQTTEVVTETTTVIPVPPSVPPPPAKELPKTSGEQKCGHGQGDVGVFCNEAEAEAYYQATKPQPTPRQITPEQQANRDRLAELQRNGTGTGDSPWVQHQKEIMAKKQASQ